MSIRLRPVAFMSLLCLVAVPLAIAADGDGSVSIHGERKQWHAITLDLAGPAASESGSPNPFRDYRMTVTFTHGGTTLVIPGYFAADGDAAETSATAGNVWRAHLCALHTGTWSYEVDFRSGTDVAIHGGGSELAPFDGVSGSFDVGPSDKSGVDFRAPAYGKLEYVGEHALAWRGSGDYFFKVGMNHPEVFLEYEDFDNTDTSRDYSDHAGDWNDGDPTWQGGAGSEIIGVVNYLSSQGMNVQYFLTMNTEGDGKETWPWIASKAIWEYDVSKLDQWGIVFAHMIAKGVMPHMVLDERENQSLFEYLDDSSDTFADSRKLYYREMIARFGHLNAVTWNVGEENGWSNGSVYGQSTTTAQRLERAGYIGDLSPYADHIVVHNGPSNDDDIFIDLVGEPAFTGPSFQGSLSSTNHGNGRIAHWRTQSAASGHKWVVTYDEPYKGGKPGRDTWRQNALWASIAGGGAGAEIYSSGDTSRQNWRDFAAHFPDLRRAKEFLLDNDIPFWQMAPDNDLVSSGWATATPGSVYLIYLRDGGSTDLDLSGQSGSFDVQWFDPRNDRPLLSGSVTSVAGGGSVSLGAPPDASSDDWVILVRAAGGGGNIPPQVDAGSDQSIVLGAGVSLDGTVSDADDDPLIVSWSQDSGPGSVSFDDASAVDTGASFAVAGTYVLRLEADDGTDTRADTVQITVSEPGPVALAIDCGGDGHTTADGIVYASDSGYLGGNESSTTAAIAGTNEDPLYQDSRYGDPLEYSIAVPDGSYILVLHFCENYFDSDGARIFDGIIEGVLEIDDLDLHHIAGGQHVAWDLRIPVTIADGSLDLSFPASTNNATLTGFRLERQLRSIWMQDMQTDTWSCTPLPQSETEIDGGIRFDGLDPAATHRLAPVPIAGG